MLSDQAANPFNIYQCYQERVMAHLENSEIKDHVLLKQVLINKYFHCSVYLVG